MGEILGIYIGDQKIGETASDNLEIGNAYESDNFKIPRLGNSTSFELEFESSPLFNRNKYQFYKATKTKLYFKNFFGRITVSVKDFGSLVELKSGYMHGSIVEIN